MYEYDIFRLCMIDTLMLIPEVQIQAIELAL